MLIKTYFTRIAISCPKIEIHNIEINKMQSYMGAKGNIANKQFSTQTVTKIVK